MFEIGFTELLLVLVVSFFLLNKNDVKTIISFLRTMIIKLQSIKNEVLEIIQDIDLEQNMGSKIRKGRTKNKTEYLEPNDAIKSKKQNKD